MPGRPKRMDHPIAGYLIGFIFMAMTLAVLAGVVHHLSVSPHGPQWLKPLIAKHLQEPPSPILAEARRLEEQKIHEHFHHVVAYPKLPENEQPVCFICHSEFPHGKSKKVRALLNMHTEYMVCEACHIDTKSETKIVYQWFSPLDDKPEGPFPGTTYDPETGRLVEGKNKLFKLTPFIQKGGRLEAATQKQDAPLARDYMRVRDQLTPEQRDGVKNQFHVNITPRGFGCKVCHATKGILDFKNLGFAENRIADLEQLNIKGMLTKYKEFYLPDLFKTRQ